MRFPSRRSDDIARFVLAALAASLIATPAAAADNGCNTAACLKRVCKAKCIERVQVRMHNEHRRAVVRPHRAWINSTARCESGGNWRINTGNGFYGGMQFTLSSWAAVGGKGMPHHNGKLEQMYRSVKLLRLQGRGAWPVCGR